MTGVTATQDSVASEAKAWLVANWDSDLSLLEWRDRLVDSGWAVPSWPERWYGRGLPAWADDVVRAELSAAGAVGLPTGVGMNLAAPTLMTQGPDLVRERFLRKILTGEETWCQLFSEPGAGSDLAGLSTKAELDGDEWVVSGQKVWNTSAHHADFGMLVARSDWDVPKHAGLTFFALPMNQPGVEVRPLRQMNFHSSFNEVFMDEARVPADYVVGEIGNGWKAALTTLAFERRFGNLGRPRFAASEGLAVREAKAEADDHYATYVWYPQRAGRVDLVEERAAAHGKTGDLNLRQEMMKLHAMNVTSKWTSQRAQAARALGRPPGAEGSIGKLALSNVARQAAKVHAMIAGADAMLAGTDAPMDGLIHEILISVPGQSIAGGTDQIQRNIIGEKVLGLPREPSVDRDLPFRDVKRS
jgi:alkylation response protein AidB-like acyl-CoA dehydrogenase